MAGGGSLKFVVEVQADRANQALQAVQTAVDQAGVKMKSTLLGVGDAAAQSHGKHESALRSLKGEMAGSMRTANFFARSLNDIVPASSAAGEGLRLFGSALVGGVGIGLAIEAVLVGIKMWGEHIKEANEKAKEFAHEGLKEAEEAGKRAAAAIGNVWGNDKTANAARAQIMAMKRAEEEAHPRVDAMKEGKDKEEAEKKLQELVRQRVELEQALPGKVYREWQEFEKKKAEQAEKDAKEAEKAAKEAAIRAAALREGGAPLAPKGMAPELGPALSGVASPKSLAQIEAEATAARNARDAFIEAEKAKNQLLGKTVGFAGAGASGIPDIDQYVKDQEKLRKGSKLARDELAALQKQAESVTSTATQIGEAFGTALAKGLSPIKALTAALKVAMQQMLQFAIKVITTHAAEAAAGAASSQAGIPIAGPVLAAGAMTAMLGLVLGLVGSLPSAAGGMRVPRDTMAFIHKDEHVIPARIARQYERGSPGDGAGTQIQIVAFDGRDVLRTFKRNTTARIEADRWSRRTRRA